MHPNKPIPLCLVIPTLDAGGAEKQLCLLATGLDRTRIEPTVITLTRDGPRRKSLDDANIQVISINKRGKLDIFAIRRLVHSIQQLRPTIVHTWIFAANCYGRVAANWARVPVILGGERSVDPWKRQWHFMLDRFLSKRCQGIITNSTGVQEFYSKHGISSDRFFVIPNGVEAPSPPKISRAEAFRRLEIPLDKKLLIAVGRLWPQKGYRDLIWAAEMLRILRGDTHFAILGDGPERQSLQLFRDQIKGASAIRFYGHRNDVNEILPHADIFLNGSRYEGQPNAVLEAMSAGVSVIATDIPGNRDLVIPFETGLLFPPGDVHSLIQHIHQSLGAPDRLKNFGLACQQRIREHFSIAAMIQRHTELYERLASEVSLSDTKAAKKRI